MGDKKNIDRLFQEQFKNFEAVPSDAMWAVIQSKLDEKDNGKKRVPIWMLFTGVAATVMIFIAFSVSLLSTNEELDKVVVTPKSQDLINVKKNSPDVKKEVLLVNHNSEKNVDSELKKEEDVTTVDVFDLNKSIVKSVDKLFILQDIIAFSNVESSKTHRGSDDKNNEILLFDGKSVLERKNDLTQNAFDEIAVKKEIVSSSNNKNLEIARKKNVIIKSNNDKLGIENIVRNTSKLSGNNNSLLEEKTNSIYTSTIKEGLTITNNNAQERTFVGNPKVKSSFGLAKKGNHLSDEGVVSESEIVSNPDNLVSDEKNVVVEDCIDEEIEELTEKTIEEAIAEIEDEQDEEDNNEDEVAFNKWKIVPNIAPVYYNTLSTGSPIDSELSGNKKKGKINMSYGVGVGYAINKKLTLRTGINKVSLGFDTEGVAVNTNQETVGGVRGVKNINLSPAMASLNIASSESLSISQIPSSFSSLYNSSLNQRLGYIEVPIELSYKISNKKMKIDVIAGMSTFFLNKNDIYTVTNGIETHIGGANNLNKMSYSTNIGLGFNYNISKAFNFNFEPTFKYQLNAFSNDSGNFKPYILGVYTGFSFKF